MDLQYLDNFPIIEAGKDYLSVSETLGPFNDTHRRLCARVPLIDDMFCESNPYPEDFTAVMTTNNPNVTVTPRRIAVTIEDRLERECGEHTVLFVSSRFTQLLCSPTSNTCRTIIKRLPAPAIPASLAVSGGILVGCLSFAY